MFTYTTLFLGSFIVALVAIFVFKVVGDTRKAISKSNERIDLVERTPTHQYEGAARMAGAGAQFPPDDAGQGMSWRSAKLTPAAADEHSVFQSHGSDAPFPAHAPVQAERPQKSKSCSLYDIGTVDPVIVSDSGDSAYEVTSHGPFDNLED